MIYFDNAASSRVDNEVLDLFIKESRDNFANASANHAFGQKLNNNENKIKQSILNSFSLNDKEYEVIFTSGATESNNLAILGFARANKNKGKHLITTSIEHASVYNVFKHLENEGFEVTYLDILPNGLISVDEFKKAIRKDTILVSIMTVNNELGNILNVGEIKDVLKDYPNIIFHSDLAQSVGKAPLNFKLFDMFTISSYKLHGIKGIGALILKKKIRLEPLMYGGHQEYDIRSGTVNYPLIVTFDFIIKKTMKNFKSNWDYILNLKNTLVSKIKEDEFLNNEVIIHDFKENQTPYILNISLKTKSASVIVEALSNEEIYVSTKSSCSSKIKEMSRPVYSLTKNENEALNSIRISFSNDNNLEEINIFIHTLKKYLEKIRSIK